MEKYLLEEDYLDRKGYFKDDKIIWEVLPLSVYEDKKEAFLKELFREGKSIKSKRNGRKKLAEKHKFFYIDECFVLPDGYIILDKMLGSGDIVVVIYEDDLHYQPIGYI